MAQVESCRCGLHPRLGASGPVDFGNFPRFLMQGELVRYTSLEEAMSDIAAWQRATFPDATPTSVAHHLLQESQELLRNPGDGLEMADAFILLTWLVVNGEVDLLEQVNKKMEVNRARKWGKPDENGVINHVRGEALLEE